MPGSYVPMINAGMYFPGTKINHEIDGSLKVTLPDGRWWRYMPSTNINDVCIDVFTGYVEWKKNLSNSDMYYGPNPPVAPVTPFVPAPPPPTILTTHTSPVAPAPSSAYADAVIAMMNDQINTQKKDIEALKVRIEAQENQIKQLRTDMVNQGAEMYSLGQENRELRERGDALEDQNEAVTEELEDTKEELAQALRSKKKKGSNDGGVVTNIVDPTGMTYTVNAPMGLNGDQLAARVTRELDRKGLLRNPW